MPPDLLYQVALTLVPHIGPVQARILLQHAEPEELFHAKKHFLEKIDGIGPVRASAIRNFRDFKRAESEIRFIERFRIRPLFITASDYPRRLLHCPDAPTLLYYRGTADLNAPRILALVGTRRPSEYGRRCTENLLGALHSAGITVISGLALGIDAMAHRLALYHQLPTVAVLAHGLDRLYPAEHNGLAKELLRNRGGLLTEFRSGTEPDKHHFPSRNRIVAGLCDATVVVETGEKGGSMITADLANDYHREVFAVPGRITDQRSAGCNLLIRTNRAQLLDNPESLKEQLGWLERTGGPHVWQQELFPTLNMQSEGISSILQRRGALHVDELQAETNLSGSALAAALLELELAGRIVSLPGKMYRLS